MLFWEEWRMKKRGETIGENIAIKIKIVLILLMIVLINLLFLHLNEVLFR